MTADSRELLPLAEFLSQQGHAVYLSTIIGHESIDVPGAAKAMGRVSLVTWLQQVQCELEEVIRRSKQPVFVLGTSFGGLLAMYLAQRYHKAIAGVALLAVPIRFRFPLWEKGLPILSMLPEFLYPCFGTIAKAPDTVQRAFERHRLDSYSIGAAVRLIRLRSRVLEGAWPVDLATIILHAPEDKILDPQSPQLLQTYANVDESDVYSLPGGSHELAIGMRYQEVQQIVHRWSCSVIKSAPVK